MEEFNDNKLKIMVDEMNRFPTALILARGGSKEIPGKNLVTINSKTLLRRTIEIAKAAEIFDMIWVSTDDLEIYKEARNTGAYVFGRSERTASDNATSFDAVKEFCDFFPNVTVIALLQCTSPFQSPLFLRKAYYMMNKLNYDSVFSVTRSYKLRWKKHRNNTCQPLNFSIKVRPRRQDINDEFVENGMFYWFRVKLVKNNVFQGGKMGFVEIPQTRSLEIDNFEDLKYARYIGNRLLPIIENEKSICLPEENRWT